MPKTDTPTPKAAIADLRRRARSRKRALANLQVAETALNEAIVAADYAGVPKLTIFQESGYGSRQTIYHVLGKA